MPYRYDDQGDDDADFDQIDFAEPVESEVA